MLFQVHLTWRHFEISTEMTSTSQPMRTLQSDEEGDERETLLVHMNTFILMVSCAFMIIIGEICLPSTLGLTACLNKFRIRAAGVQGNQSQSDNI